MGSMMQLYILLTRKRLCMTHNSKQQDNRDTYPNPRKFVKHPVLGGCQPFKVFFGTTRLYKEKNTYISTQLEEERGG